MDTRDYTTIDLARNTSQYFSGYQWIVGDSAYKLSAAVRTPFRDNSTEETLKEINEFSKTLGKYHIKIVHSFGHQKEKFNSLKEFKIELKMMTPLGSHAVGILSVQFCISSLFSREMIQTFINHGFGYVG